MSKQIIVVGGGVIGLSIAYYLARGGARVTLLERDQVGTHASTVAAGMLAAQLECEGDDPFYRLCLASRNAYPGLAAALMAETGVDIELDLNGIVRVARTADEAAHLRESADWQRAAGERVEELSGAEVAARAPGLAPALSGLRALGDGQVNNVRLIAALAQACRLRGVDVREGTPVLGFVRAGERVVGVQTAAGELRAEYVVLAAGAWAGVLAKGLGVELPIFPIRGQLWWTNHNPQTFRDVVWGFGVYMAPKRDGRMVVGATMEPDAGFDVAPHLAPYLQVGQKAAQLYPGVVQEPILRTLVGLRPGSGDGWPLLGELPRAAGLYVAGGHQRNGILLAPITGQAVAADLLGEPTPVDLTPFSPARFMQMVQAR